MVSPPPSGDCWKSSRPSRILDQPTVPGSAPTAPATRTNAMKATDVIDNDQLRDDIPGLRARRRGQGPRPRRRGQQGAHPGVPGQRHRPPGQRSAGDLHGPQAELRRRRRAHVPLHTPTVTKIEVVKRGDVRRPSCTTSAAAPARPPRSAKSASTDRSPVLGGSRRVLRHSPHGSSRGAVAWSRRTSSTGSAVKSAPRPGTASGATRSSVATGAARSARST